jgi:hypothetical protein
MLALKGCIDDVQELGLAEMSVTPRDISSDAIFTAAATPTDAVNAAARVPHANAVPMS